MITWTPEFPEPKSVKECLSRESIVADEILDVQNQLSDKRRYHPDGKMYSLQEYEDWRRKAKFYWRLKSAHIRMLKDWRRNQQPETTAAYSTERGESRKMLGAAFNLLVADACAQSIPAIQDHREMVDYYFKAARGESR